MAQFPQVKMTKQMQKFFCFTHPLAFTNVFAQPGTVNTSRGKFHPEGLKTSNGGHISGFLGQVHRITESQNSRGWKGPLWVI